MLRLDYVTTARSKGLDERVVIMKHALRNALNPMITLFGYTLLPNKTAWDYYAFVAILFLLFSAMQSAATLIEEHHLAGRDVIIVSASGAEVVEPIGEMLGADGVIATRMQIVDGKYSGDIDFYAYAENKATAIEELAAEKGYDLARSYAYSDSVTDLHMLEIVGHPYAVNPDKELRKIAAAIDAKISDLHDKITRATEHDLDALITVPWTRRAGDGKIDLDAVEAAFAQEHLGMDESKERLLEVLSRPGAGMIAGPA